MKKEVNSQKKRKWIWFLIPAAILMIAGVCVFFLLWKPAQNIYLTAVEDVRASAYEESCRKIDSAIHAMDGNPFSAGYSQKLTELKDDLRRKEFEKALESGDLERAAALAEELPAEYGERQKEAALQREEEFRREQEAIQREEEKRIEEAYLKADQLEQEGKDEDAEQAFLALGDYKDSQSRAGLIRERINLNQARAVFNGNNYLEAAEALKALGTEQAEKEAEELLKAREEKRTLICADAKDRIAAGTWHIAAAGTISSWIKGDTRYSDITEQADKVFSGPASIFFVKDGKVITTGETFGEEEKISALTDVVDIASGITHCAFLTGNGRVTGVGSNGYGKLEVDKWLRIKDIAAGAWHTVGLEQSGYTVACGNNDHGQCDVSAWENITAVSAGLWHTAGLKADGTVVACGDNSYGQCDVSEWTDIISISCGACYTVGLKADGTVVACGDNEAGQCEVSDWTEIAAIAAGTYHTIGMRLDGSLNICGIVPAEWNPDTLVMETGWDGDPQKATENVKNPVANAYIEGENSELGPWLYLDSNGAVTIFIDDTVDRRPFRLDMIARAGILPEGRVTNPEAKGTVIRMITELPEVQARKANAVVAFTGDYIGYTSNRKAVMMRNGITYYDRDETTTLAIMPEGTLNVYSKGEIHAEQLVSKGVKDSFSFGPLLIKDGSIVYKQKGETVITMRVVFGYTDPYHYVTLVTQRDRLNQMSYMMTAEVMQRYGVKVAYNLDGGHSTSLVFMGKELSLYGSKGKHTNIRGLSDIIIFLHNEKVQPIQ